MTTTLTRPETEYSHLGSAQMAGGRRCEGCPRCQDATSSSFSRLEQDRLRFRPRAEMPGPGAEMPGYLSGSGTQMNCGPLLLIPAGGSGNPETEAGGSLPTKPLPKAPA